ncbi:MAG: hypothetical protein WC374_03415 [Phycisphaerae bacterium]|jgi:preprotein translocase subunit SecG
MLSFQSDPEQQVWEPNNNVPAGNTNQPANTAGKTPAPADGNANNQEYLTVGDRQGQLRQSTYLLVTLFIIGAVCLFLMIKKSSPSAASAAQPSAQQLEQSKIEAAIAKITGVRAQMFSSLEKIVKKFYEFADFEQVEVDELSKNPFRQDDYNANIISQDRNIQPEMARSELELYTIMSTEKGNCCMINDKLLYKGDVIDGLEVEEITSHTVTLTDGETSMVLRLSESF